jgi:hypothetical protein
MIRGEFIRADGFVIPNNISLAGARMLLAAALSNTVPTLYMALVQGQVDPDMTMLNMTEPTIGVMGYARQAITRDSAGWPTVTSSGVESYAETDWHLWSPTGSGFDKAIQRVALVHQATYDSSEDVFCLSEAFPDPITLLPSTDVGLRRFKYRIYI